jgi:hypothetical protein
LFDRSTSSLKLSSFAINTSNITCVQYFNPRVFLLGMFIFVRKNHLVAALLLFLRCSSIPHISVAASESTSRTHTSFKPYFLIYTINVNGHLIFSRSNIVLFVYYFKLRKSGKFALR